MTTILVFDTETTDFPKQGYLRQNGQARIIQLAIRLTDDRGKNLHTFSSLLYPEVPQVEDPWKVSESAGAVHGITEDDCANYGYNTNGALKSLLFLADKADYVVAHNIAFDNRMVEIELEYQRSLLRLDERKFYCTCENAILPVNDRMRGNPDYRQGKKPKLSEAYFCATGKQIGPKAHDALVDVNACLAVFSWLTGIGGFHK